MKRLKISVTVGFCLTMGLLLASLLPTAISAQTDPVLPPRPTPDPATSTSMQMGATIILRASVDAEHSLDADDWAIVQWQDDNGGWNDIEGWQGNLTYNVSLKSWEVIWWVERANFGEESFRWVVYSDDTQADLEMTSEMFDLPQDHTQGVVVSLGE